MIRRPAFYLELCRNPKHIWFIMKSIPPEEIIIEILKKASLKSLHRLKWASKSWYSLIKNEVLLPQVVEYPNPFIYYHRYKQNANGADQLFISLANPKDDHIIHDSFDFLPVSKPIVILDTCNGLILCCKFSENKRYFVCNPMDRTYNEISGIDAYSALYLIDFNPLKSPHYNLVAVKWSSLSRALEFDVYHSNERRFQKKLFHVKCMTAIEWERGYIALWNGCVYFQCVIGDDLMEEPEVKVLKISGVLQGGANPHENKISYGFVKFPRGISWSRKGELYSYMGTWKGRLRFASISAQGIKVWALRDTHDDEWRLEHDSATTFLGLSEHSWLYGEELRIVGFHPIRNALLIMLKQLLYAYDFDQSSSERFFDFENDRVLPYHPLFFFSPCFANQVLA